MARAAVRTAASLVVLLFVVSVVVFGLLVIVPGDPAVSIAGDNATPEQIEAIRQDLGLDRPLVAQYASWAGRALRGDLGTSSFTSYRVSDAIVSRLPTTLSLVGLALAISVGLGIPAGVVAGWQHGRLVDRLSSGFTTLAVAMPNFWLGLVLVLVFALTLGWFPATGYVGLSADPFGWLRHLVLPAVTLGAAGAAEVARQMRGSMADVLQQDYIRTVRAKGMRTGNVVLKHGLKNGLLPVITVAGLQVNRLFGLSVIVEQIFGLNGVGSLAVESVFKRDVPMIQGIVLFVTVIVVVTNLLVDLAYTWANPKVRLA